MSEPPNHTSGLGWFVVLVTILGLYVALVVATHVGGNIVAGRLAVDPGDTAVYFERAQFYPRGLTPYRDVFSEYPPLATLAFAVPFLAFAQLPPPHYALSWAFLMAAAFLGTAFVVADTRQYLGLTAWPVVLLASPTLLYFSLMRFDILAALLVCVALRSFLLDRTVLASLLLGVGVHLKWFPAVLFLVILAYELRRDLPATTRVADLMRSRSMDCTVAFLAPVFGILFATAVVAGWEGVLVPYNFHAVRGGQYFNPYWVTERLFDQTGAGLPAVVDLAFLVSQLSIVGVLAWRPPRSRHEVLQYSVLAVVLFITFAKVDSPQWILWYAPLVLMFARHSKTFVAFVLVTTLNYLVFPYAYDYTSPASESTVFSALVFAKDLALLALLAGVLWWERPLHGGAALGRSPHVQPA